MHHLEENVTLDNKWCHNNGQVINASKIKLMYLKQRHLENLHIKVKFHDTECLHNKQ